MFLGTKFRRSFLIGMLVALMLPGHVGAFTVQNLNPVKLLAYFKSKKSPSLIINHDTKSTQNQASPEKTLAADHTLTVWVHGTSKRAVLLKGRTKNRGFFKADDIPDCAYSKKVATTLSNQDAKKFPKQSFYIFNWSGKLSFRERERAALELYEAITQEVDLYKKSYGVTPKVRIITHSHGGNLALNLAKVKYDDANFCVDELILLACPVQEITALFIKDPFFKKVYVLYSGHDFIQILAPQGFGISKRHFPEHPTVTHARVVIHGRSPFHFEYTNARFMSYLPRILTALEAHKENNRLVVRIKKSDTVPA